MAATPGGRALTSAARTTGLTTSRHVMPFGAEFQSGGSVRFSLWAPGNERIGIQINDAAAALPMRHEADGWHRLTTDRAGAGSPLPLPPPRGGCVAGSASG